MVCKARLSCRSPPRFSRWRTTWPEEASTGAAPASIAKAASERSRPGWDQLISTWAAVTGPIPGWASSTGAIAVTSLRSSASSSLASARAVSARWAVRPAPHGGAVLHRIAGCGHQRGAGAELWQPGPPSQAVRSGSGAVTISALSCRRASAPAWTAPGAGGVQHPQRLPVPALAWAGQVLAGQRFAAGPDRVQGIALGAVAAAGPLGPVDLDHPLTLVDQEAGQPGPIAAGPFQRPDPTTWCLRRGQLEQPSVADPVAWHLQGGPHPAVGVQQRRSVACRGGCRPR